MTVIFSYAENPLFCRVECARGFGSNECARTSGQSEGTGGFESAGTDTQLDVAVPVMQVRIMRMRVLQRRMMMGMRMGFAGRVIWTMRVLMMRVVHMAVFVIQNF